MNYAWLISLIIMILLGSLAIPDFSLIHRLLIAVLLISLALICFLINLLIKANKKVEENTKESIKKDKDLSTINEQFKKSVESILEIETKFKDIIKKNNIQNNEINDFVLEQNQTAQNFLNILDEAKLEKKINIKVKSREELLNILYNLEHGTTAVFYEDSEREASIKRYDGQELWEFYYYRRGFRTTITDFSLEGVIDNEYFSNAISWIK